VGTSGWSYPGWRPGFYPAGLQPPEFLAFYAQRFPAVELNTTGYRLPAEDQFASWAEQAPDGFEFAPKLPGHRLRGLDVFEARVRLLGERLGPVRISLKSARDDGVLELLLGSLDPSLRLAFDLDHAAPFRYLRLREPPYDDEALRALAARVRVADEPVYVFFRHEDEPTAPAYAQRLVELLSAA